jgi:hypothetical protein
MQLSRIGRWAIRIGIWLVGAGYLFMEAREVVATRQIANITIFALLFVLGSHQLSTSRLHLSLDRLAVAARCYRCSTLMFLASLMAVFDAALDFLIGSLPASHLPGPIWESLFVLGWFVNLIAVLLAIRSMEHYLPVIFEGLNPRLEDWTNDADSTGRDR